jgi:hypothetical protein
MRADLNAPVDGNHAVQLRIDDRSRDQIMPGITPRLPRRGLANPSAIRDGTARWVGTHHSANRKRSDRPCEVASSQVRHIIVRQNPAYKPSLNPALIAQPPDVKTNKINAPTYALSMTIVLTYISRRW